MTRFTHLHLERINPTQNERRFYTVAWLPTLYDAGAVVRIHRRKGSFQRVLAPLRFDSPAEAWPTVRALIRERLQHGYLVTPAKDLLQVV